MSKKKGKSVFKKSGNSTGGLSDSINPLDLFNQTVDAIKEYKTVEEKEKTKRKNIEAEKEIAIKKIESQKEVLMNYLDSTFDERRENFDNFFEVLDKGIEKDNMELVDRALSGILTIAKDNPFKSFQDFKEKFYDDDTVIDV